MKEPSDTHRSAQELIIEAAERSGLLGEVAAVLWFADKHGRPAAARDATCELRAQLTVRLAGLVGDAIFNPTPGSEGLDISPLPDEEHAP